MSRTPESELKTFKPGMRLESRYALYGASSILATSACFALLANLNDDFPMAIVVLVMIASGIMGLIPLYVVIMLLLMPWYRKVMSEQSINVLTQLNQIIQMNLPLPGALRAAGAGKDSWTERTLHSMADALSTGYSIEQAVQPVGSHLGYQTVQQIGVAERMGKLGQWLPQFISQHRQARALRENQPGISPFYLAVVLVLSVLLMMGHNVLISPKITQIYDENKLSLPWSLQFTYDLFGFMTSGVVVWIVLLAMPLLIILGIWSMSTTGRSDRLFWYIPFLRSWVRDHHLGQACSLIALGLRAGLPLPQAVLQSCDVQFIPALRRRLWQWAHLMETGRPATDAARQAGLPDLLLNLLAGRESSTHLADTMEFLASYHRTRYTRRMVVLRGIVNPLLLIVIGLFVGLQTYGLFATMTRLIWAGIHQSGAY